MFYEIIHDHGESANKCTITPLQDRSDFFIFPVKGSQKFGPLRAQFFLHHEGESIDQWMKSNSPDFGAEVGIACVDSIWRRLPLLINRIEHPLPIKVKIPDGFCTAYPRKNKEDLDPARGLATIEALFVAAAFLGNWDPTLFSKYYFGKNFIESNREIFLSHGISQVDHLELFPVFPERARNSKTRRLNRGKRAR